MIKRSKDPFPGFRSVPRTGVIYVMTEAFKRGYSGENENWANLGQGAPESGELPGAPPRIDKIELKSSDLDYAPVDGLLELKDRVAALYNSRFRAGKKSQYTRDNVAISAGGRVGITRLISTIGRTNIGHFLPDYTAYEELLDAFGTFASIPLLLNPEKGYELTADELKDEILGLGLSAILFSNPCNPTGKAVSGKMLSEWVSVAREVGCTLLIDEFYSHYVYDTPNPFSSAAEFVEDVDSDPIVIVDGLTKNWRYPGLRLSWTLAPKQIIEGVASAGSFLDGGCARPIQVAALELLTPEFANREATALRNHFSPKRKFMISALADLNIPVVPTPSGGFYCWGNLANLPTSINNGMDLFKALLEQNVIVVPGSFFDINPGHRRPDRPSRFQNFVRFSFGPKLREVELGIEGLRKVIKNAR